RPARRPGRAGDDRPAPAARGAAGDRDRLLPAGGSRPRAAAGDDGPRARLLRPAPPRRTPGRPGPALRADRVLVVRPPPAEEWPTGRRRRAARDGRRPTAPGTGAHSQLLLQPRSDAICARLLKQRRPRLAVLRPRRLRGRVAAR